MRRCPRRLLTLLLTVFLAASCKQAPQTDTLRLSGETMGTTWSLLTRPQAGDVDGDALQQRLQTRLEQINRLMSTYDPNSEISRFNEHQSDAWFAVSADTLRVIELSQEVSRMTDGAFDVTVGPLVDLWGFGPPGQGEELPAETRIAEVLARVGHDKLRLRREPAAIAKQVPALRVDLSAVAKGYAVDALAEILDQRGLQNYLVEIGGELRMAGTRSDGTPWRIAIENPQEDVREVAVTFPLTDISLATSGNYRNFYVVNGQRYAHTIDPAAGRPVRHRLASVTVLDPSCARADALATALMVLGEEKGRRFCEEHGIAAYFLIHDKESLTSYASPAFRHFTGEGDAQ